MQFINCISFLLRLIDDRSYNLLTIKVTFMPKYIIEREIPGAGALSASELQLIAQKSCGVLRDLAGSAQWLESYVTDNKVYCIYLADNEQAIRQHAELGGFPVNSIAQVKSIIDPSTAE